MNAIFEELQATNPDVRAELLKHADGRFQVIVSRWSSAPEARAWVPLREDITLAESEERARMLALEMLHTYREVGAIADAE